MLFSIFKNKQKDKPTFKSCKTLPMYNFYNILDSNDYRWLLKNFDEDIELTLPNKEKERLELIFKDIFNEYIELKNDIKIINNLKQRARIANLENRLFWGVTLLKLYAKNPTQETADALKEWKFKVDFKGSLKKEIESITNQLKALRTNINIEIAKYDKSVEQNKNQKEVKSNIDEQTISIAKVLELNFPIIAKTTTVSQWVAYCKNADRVIKQRNKKTVENNG